MNTRAFFTFILFAIASFLAFVACESSASKANKTSTPDGNISEASAERSDNPEIDEGRRVFRFETFGDEKFWTDTAKMHEVIATSVSPKKALEVGLKVDADAIPPDVATGIRNGTVDLNNPDTTVALLKLNAVVGLKGAVRSVDGKDQLASVGITCALCHSTVDNSFSQGIGKRKDGWPNRDLNVGAIIALSPAIPADKKQVYNSWGPGKYDPRYNLDGKNTPLVIPPAYGLENIKNETYTAEGPISYWNAYVAVTQMHGQGNFSDRRLDIDVKNNPDLVTPLLPPLRAYQHSLRAPKPAESAGDAAAARRGRTVFEANCMTCHKNANGTDNNDGALHDPAETGMNGDYAARTANKRYRTTPLRGLAQHPPYFHDGSAQSLDAVVDHYDRVRKLGLSDAQKRDLSAYLKTL
jgi:mono/diheme cytochrome c family protein